MAEAIRDTENRPLYASREQLFVKRWPADSVKLLYWDRDGFAIQRSDWRRGRTPFRWLHRIYLDILHIKGVYVECHGIREIRSPAGHARYAGTQDCRARA